MISVLGVPGYAEAKRTPASQAPRAMASLPDRITGSGASAFAAAAATSGGVMRRPSVGSGRECVDRHAPYRAI